MSGASMLSSKRKPKLPRGMSMVIPVLGIMFLSYLVFMVGPILYALIGSFFDWNPLRGEATFIGLANYAEALTYPLTWISLGNSIVFTVVVVFFRTAIGLVFAVMINGVKRFKSFFRTVYFLPVVTSMVSVSLVWRYLLYNPAFGILNQTLNSINLPGLDWLRSSTTALISIMLMTIWKDAGYAVVLYLAGLQGIPHQLNEAAMIDGAGRFRIFWNITLPQLRNTTTLVIITSIISYLQAFTQILVMTDTGGPGTSTYTMVFYLYNEAFVKYRFGYASALSFILFVVIMLLSMLQIRATKEAN